MNRNQMWLLRDIIEDIVKKLPLEGGRKTEVTFKFSTPEECDLRQLSKELNDACYKKELRQSAE